MAIKGPASMSFTQTELLRRATQGRPLTESRQDDPHDQRPGRSGVEGSHRLQAIRTAVGRVARQATPSDSASEARRPLGPAVRMDLEAQLGDPLSARARAQFEGLPLGDWQAVQDGRLNMRDADVRAALPESVQESYDWYYNKAEANDWGTARVLARQVGDDPIFLVATTTDGSEHYMELFDARGNALGSGQQMDGELTQWDQRQGDCRQHLAQY